MSTYTFLNIERLSDEALQQFKVLQFRKLGELTKLELACIDDNDYAGADEIQTFKKECVSKMVAADRESARRRFEA